MSKGQSLQDPFLNALRKQRIPVSVYLVSGIKLQGQIESFDQFVILLKNAVSQMVYKHAISTVVPARPVKLPMPGGMQHGGMRSGGMHGGNIQQGGGMHGGPGGMTGGMTGGMSGPMSSGPGGPGGMSDDDYEDEDESGPSGNR